MCTDQEANRDSMWLERVTRNESGTEGYLHAMFLLVRPIHLHLLDA
jgi:hypothetical protein